MGSGVSLLSAVCFIAAVVLLLVTIKLRESMFLIRAICKIRKKIKSNRPSSKFHELPTGPNDNLKGTNEHGRKKL